MIKKVEKPAYDLVQSFAKGIKVIKAFDESSPRMTLAEVAAKADLTRATAGRFLHTLLDLDYVNTDGKEFWLRARILELGYAYLSSLSLAELATPHLKILTDEVNESSSISVLDGTDIVYVARVPVRKIMTVSISVGTKFPAYATSMGRVLLAYLREEELEKYLDQVAFSKLTESTVIDKEELKTILSDVRQKGWSYVKQELAVGLQSIAVPIFDENKNVVAATNISMSFKSIDEKEIEENFLKPLIATSTQISHDLMATFST